MSHEVETMAYANEVPWHGLGNNLKPGAEIEEWLHAAGLDWNVAMHPMFTVVDGEYIKVPNQSALVRSTDHKILTTASDQWKPIQNREVLEFFRDYADAGGATLETAGSLHGGRMVWGLANLGKGFTTNNGGDAVKGYVLFAASHQKGKSSSARLTATRVVCANTMAIAMNDEETVYKQSHTNFFDFGAAKETMNLAREGMNQLELNAKALEQLKMSEFDTVRLLAKFFRPEIKTDADVSEFIADDSAPRNNLHKIMQCVNGGPGVVGATPGNGWGVLNGVTYFFDHVNGSTRDGRLTSAWFGKGSQMKQEVEKALLEMID
jgi:phage/plasmid-like protein (TIGR03299 family)